MMNGLTVKQWKRIRNLIILAGMLLSFLLWLWMPSVIKNNPLVHVGNGAYGLKQGALLSVLLPLIGLIPQKPGEEIHTADPGERAKIEEERERRSTKTQVLVAAIESVIACLVMLLGTAFA